MPAKAKNNKSNSPSKTNWGEGRWKKMIVEQRKFLWSDDLIPVYAKWMGLRPGMVAVDVGCGLGYLGYTYWKYFGKGGKYIGIDLSEDLLKEAEQGAKVWARGGRHEFIRGDAHNLIFPDKSVDWVMCQTLMMHLKEPQKALKEMIRILKPGGLFMCKEPDNLTGTLGRQFHTWYNLNFEDQMFMNRYHILCHIGRKKLGRGDDTIGNKIPHILAALGMVDIDVRLNDKVWFFQPPYASEVQKHRMKSIVENLNDRQERKFWMDMAKEEILAGGGKLSDFKRANEIMKKMRAIGRKQLRENRLASCSGGFFYIIKARRPKRLRKN